MKNAAHGAIANYEVARNRQTGLTYEEMMGIEEEKKEEVAASTASTQAAAQQANSQDDRPINAAGIYDLDAFLMDHEIEEV